MSTTTTSFYHTRGTLRQDAPSYVERKADRDLHDALQRGEFCYVLTSRQMGKSSLMVHTSTRLLQEGVAVARLDLTAIGQNLTVEQWYDGLTVHLGRQLDLEDELEEYWLDHERQSPLQRWFGAVREVVLGRCPGRVVIFIDEIDAVRSLPFSTDEFFAAIRECYNRRTEDPEFERLTFCLLGVATPSDLIQDTRTTPFNIGHRIELTDFTQAEASPLARGIADCGLRIAGCEGLLQRILYWTGGHPYLTQRLCQAAATAHAADPGPQSAIRDPQSVDRLCEELFFASRAREQDDNLLFVRERLLNNEADRASLLDLYTQVLRGTLVRDDETNQLVSLLRLSGITRSVSGTLRVRNRVYERVFDREWITLHMPDAELRRQKAAYRRGLLRAAAVSAAILAMVGGLAVTAVRQSQRAERQRQVALEGQRSLRRHLYASQMNLAEQALETANIPRAVELLSAWRPAPGQEELRGFEWGYFWRLSQRDDARTRLETGQKDVWAVVYSPDGRRFVTTGNRPVVKVWDGPTKRELLSLPGQGGGGPVAFSADGRFLAWGSANELVRVLDMRTMRQAATLTGHPARAYSLAFSPDGKRLVSAGGGTLRMWDTTIWGLIAAWSGDGPLVFSPDGRTLASGGEKAIRLWDAATRRETGRLQGLGDSPRSIAFSPNGKLLAAGGRFTEAVDLWEVRTRQLVAPLFGRRGERISLAFSPDGRKLAIGSTDGVIRLWNVASRKEVAALIGHQKAVTCVAFSPDGKTLVSGSADETVRFWSTSSKGEGFLRGHADALYTLAISPDGRRLVSGGADRTVRLWDLQAGRTIASFSGNTSGVSHVAISPDGRMVTSGGRDRSIRLWDVATRRQIVRFQRKEDVPAYPVAFSPDGRLLVWADDGNLVRLWNIATRQMAGTLRGHVGFVGFMLFSPDGRILATGAGPPDARVKLWDTATWQEIAKFEGQQGWAGPLAFSPDGKLLVAVSGDYTARVWDMVRKRLATTLKGNTNQMSWVGISPDGRTLLTSCHDGILRLWSTASWTEAGTLKDPRIAEGIAFAPDGKSLYVGEADGAIRVWRADSIAEVEVQLELARHQQEAGEPERLGNWAAAIPPLNWLIERQPKEPDLRIRRGWAYAELGRLDRAAADFAAAFALRTDDIQGAPFLVTTQLGMGDTPGYQKSCAELLRRTRGPLGKFPGVANGVAWWCALAPHAVPAPEAPVRLAERALAWQPEDRGVLNTLGAVLYRAGRFEAAIHRLNEGIQHDPKGATPEDWLFLAMAHHALGHSQAARQAFDKAARWIDSEMSHQSGGPGSERNWLGRLQLQLLRREAEALLRRGTHPPTQAPAS